MFHLIVLCPVLAVNCEFNTKKTHLFMEIAFSTYLEPEIMKKNHSYIGPHHDGPSGSHYISPPPPPNKCDLTTGLRYISMGDTKASGVRWDHKRFYCLGDA